MGAYGSPELHPNFDNSRQPYENMVVCKRCGTNYHKINKKCPNCGISHKRPLHKRWWFWLIIGIFVISMFGGNSSESNRPLNPQEYMNQCTMFTYGDIARNPQQYQNKDVCFYGEVMQVQENGSHITLLVNMTLGDYNIWSDTVWVDYTRGENDYRVLEKDIVNVYGVSKGIKTYMAVLGNSKSVPYIKAKIVELSAFEVPEYDLQAEIDKQVQKYQKDAEKYLEENNVWDY